MQRDFADQFFFNSTFGSFLKEWKWHERSFESSRSLSENYNRNEKMRNREQIFGNLRRIAELFNENSREFGPILSFLQ